MPSRFSLKPLLVAAAITIAASASHSDDTKTLRIKLPDAIPASKALVVSGQSGEFGGIFGKITATPGSNEFTADIRASAAGVKALVFVPGYAMHPLDLAPKDIPTTPIKVQLKKLPTLPLQIKLTTLDRTPIAGRKLVLRQTIPENELLGYWDGMVFARQAEPVASGITDSRGMLTVSVPAILDDPIYASCPQHTPGFTLSIGDSTSKDPRAMLVPGILPAQKTYDRPQPVRQFRYAKITGVVSQSFLDKHGISEPMGEVDGPDGGKVYHILVQADISCVKTWISIVRSDGSFELSHIWPSTYDDICLQVVHVENGVNKIVKSVKLETNCTLQENSTKTFDLK